MSEVVQSAKSSRLARLSHTVDDDAEENEWDTLWRTRLAMWLMLHRTTGDAARSIIPVSKTTQPTIVEQRCSVVVVAVVSKWFMSVRLTTAGRDGP